MKKKKKLFDSYCSFFNYYRVTQFLRLWVKVAYYPDFKKAGLLPILLDFLEKQLQPKYIDGVNQVKLALLKVIYLFNVIVKICYVY